MKILLAAINAKYIHSNLAIYSLRACAGEYQEMVEPAEYTINNRKDVILADIYKRKADVVCFSCYIWNIAYVESVAVEYHKLCPQVPIWVGGPEVSYETELFLEKHPYITGVMVGEGEETFYEICRHYGEGRNFDRLREIAGLVYRGSGRELIRTEERAPLDLSDIPFCYDSLEDFSNRIIYYESSRGCPFSCSYCLSSVEKHLRFRSLDLVKKELQFFMDHQIPQVKFVDRTFNCNHEHAEEIWRFIRENDNGITNFHFEIAADLLNAEELEILASMRPGLIQLEIGVQSVNEMTLGEIHRSMRFRRLKEVVTYIRRRGNIHQHLDLIAGLPYEGYESFRHSFDEVFALGPNQLQLGFLKVLKGSYMYEHASEYGIACQEEAPYEVLCTRWLSYEELLRLKRVEEMVEVYYNSGQYEITMKLLSAMTKSAFDFFQALGDFYEKKGYFSMSHSRIRRCEILLEFLEDSTDMDAMIREALVFDLYYRENCKTRPWWAADRALLRDKTHQHCDNGKMSHVEPFHYRFPGKDEWRLETLPERLEEPVWVLFRYDERDPLDHQAKTEYL